MSSLPCCGARPRPAPRVSTLVPFIIIVFGMSLLSSSLGPRPFPLAFYARTQKRGRGKEPSADHCWNAGTGVRMQLVTAEYNGECAFV